MRQPDHYQVMPPLSEEAFEELKNSIRKHGVLVPVIRDDLGRTLDGHQRQLAIDALRAEGIKVDYQSNIHPGLTEQEKVELAREVNLTRRHLPPAERRALIAAQLQQTPNKSDRQVAAQLHVDRETVGKVRAELEATGGMPPVEVRVGADGKARRRPGSSSIHALNERETQKALEVLDGLDASVLAPHSMSVHQLERKRREADSAARAKGIDSQPAIIGDADIRYGDFRDVLRDVQDGSVDLVATDPPYAREALPLFGDLGAFAARVLRPGGLLVSYTGQQYLPEVMAALTPHLEYVWMMAQVGEARKTHNYNRNVYANWKPILVFAKRPFKKGKWFDDVVRGNGPEKDAHRWQQGMGEALRIIENFSNPKDLVVDPMLGSGTIPAACVALDRRFIGCDIDAAAVSVARERIRAVLDGHE